MSTLATYQEEQAKTAVYPGQNSDIGLLYAALGLGAAAGDVQDSLQAAIREARPMDESLVSGLGRLLWAVSAVANEINVSLDDIAESNLDVMRRTGGA